MREDRCDQGRDICRQILIIRVGIDDHVRSQLEAGVQPGDEGPGQPLMPGKTDDVIDPALSGDRRRIVSAAIINDQPFHAVETGNLAR